MARALGPLAAALLLPVALALAAEARTTLREESWHVEVLAGRELLAKAKKDAKAVPVCESDPDGAACSDGAGHGEERGQGDEGDVHAGAGDDHEHGNGEEHDHKRREARSRKEVVEEHDRNEEGAEHDHKEEREEHDHEEEGEEHGHEEEREEHDHEEEEEEHGHEEEGGEHVDKEEGEEHDHRGEGGHSHEEHGHGEGGDFVALLGAESPVLHAFGLLDIEEGRNMTVADMARLLDALSGEAEVDKQGNGHDHSHAHKAEEEERVEVTSWVTAQALLTTYGGGGPVLTPNTFNQACPVIVACQLDPTCELAMSHSEEEEEGEHEEEDLLSLKATVSGVIFGEVLLGYAVPYAAQYLTGHLNWYISLLNTFSGGVILATGLVHLVPDVIEEQFAVELKNEYPLGTVMMSVGFLLVFFVEEVLLAGEACPHSHGKAPAKNGPLKSAKTTGRSATSSDMELKVTQSGKVCTDKPGGLESRSSISTDLGSPAHNQGEVPDGVAGFILTHRNGLILMVALVVHSMLEGIVVGLQDERDDVLLLFASIGAHKVAAAMALSARFLKTGASFWQACPFLLVFGIVGSASIMTGTVLHTVPAMARLVLNSLAAGTFVYIGAYEVVQEEFSGTKTSTLGLSAYMQRFIKFTLMVIGVSIISCIALLPHKHE